MSEHTSITALKSAEELAQELAAERARSASLQRLLTDAEQEITALHQERGRSLEARRELDDANSTIRQLLQQRKDLRRERDAAFEDAARSMRERAAAIPATTSTLDMSPVEMAEKIRALPLLPDDTRVADATCLECLSTLAQAETAGRGDEGSTAPRDSDLIQAVRALVKRYGAPAVAYEAARQARHE